MSTVQTCLFFKVFCYHMPGTRIFNGTTQIQYIGQFQLAPITHM